MSVKTALAAFILCTSVPTHAASLAPVLEIEEDVYTYTNRESTEDKPGIIGSAGRFHVTPDHRLFVVCYAAGIEAGGRQVTENRVLEILPDGSAGRPVRLPLTKPFASYFTTTVRGGSAPSRTLEMLGPRTGAGNTISYARVRLLPEP